MNGSKKAGKDDWYKLCRICLEWLHPRQDYTPESCEEWLINVVERAKAMNINALAFDLYHGGSAVFNGSVAPKDKHIGDVDLYAILDRELHKRGMKFVLMHMATHCNSFQAQEYPHWLQRDAEGKPKYGLPAYLPCLNSPWASYFMQELKGVFSRYQIDGAYIEGIHQGACYCDFCQTDFRRQYGYEMPRDPQVVAKCRDFNEFRANIETDYVRRVREVIDEVSPHTAWIPCPSIFDDPNQTTDFAAWGLYADAVELERQWGGPRYHVPLREIGMSMQIIEAESGKPPLGTVWLGYGVDCDYSPCPASHYRLNFSEMVLYGAAAQLHAQTIFDLDQSEMNTVKEMYDFVEKVRPAMVDGKLIAPIALVVEKPTYPGEWFKGYYRALVEAHVPFCVISMNDLVDEKLSSYKALLLPNVVTLSDKQINAIKRFVAMGGGLVMTYRTGFANPDGSLRADNPLLSSLVGVKGPFGVTTLPANLTSGFEIPEMGWLRHAYRNYYRIIDGGIIGTAWEGRLQSFAGSYVKVGRADGEVIAEVIDYDYTKSMHKHHPVHGWYPGEGKHPLVIVNQPRSRRAGRVIYFAGELDSAAVREGRPEVLGMLAEAAVWVGGGSLPVKIECSPTVEIATHYSPSQKTYTILFVNQTTNQLHPDWTVTHVASVHDTRISLDVGNAKVKAVTSVTGKELSWKQVKNEVQIQLPILREYEGIKVELGTSAPTRRRR